MAFWAIAAVLLLVSVIQSRAKTIQALKKAWKALVGILPQFLGIIVLVGALWIIDHASGAKALDVTLYSLKEMTLIIPPIFIILGLLDVWVPRELMVRFMGDGSGIKGISIAFVLGAAAARPLYEAFPVAQVLLRKGASLRSVVVFVGA